MPTSGEVHELVSPARALQPAVRIHAEPIGKSRRGVAVAQQLMVAPHFIDDAGRVLLGLEPNEPIL